MVRTSFALETSQEGARIPGLWQGFFSQGAGSQVPGRKNDFVYGVYYDYESDYKGAYSLLAGVEVAEGASTAEGCVAITVPTAEYLVFSGQGEMPHVVIATWQRAYACFEKASDMRRAHTVDFERYDFSNPNSARVDIHISVRAAVLGGAIS